MAEKRRKIRQVRYRTTETFYQAILEAARKDARTVTSLIDKLLQDHLQKLGIDPDNLPPSKE
jgi:hypothetical protein